MKDAYPLPRIDDALDQLAEAKWFHTLDLASVYWQVAMNPYSHEKTAFCTHLGLYEWLVMPFGLCSAPATFKRLMERVLAGLVWHGVLVYIDNIIALGSTWEGALERLEQVLVRLYCANLKLKAKKCFLFRKEVEYLGHEVSEEASLECQSHGAQALGHPSGPRQIKKFSGARVLLQEFCA